MKQLLFLLSMVAVTAQGQSVQDRVTALEGDAVVQDGRLTAIETEQTTQNGLLDALEAAPGGAPAPLKYVGFSTNQVAADVGFAGMAAACQVDFPDSRIATTLEIVSATDFPPEPPAVAWVQPVLVNAADGGNTENIYADASGVVLKSASPRVNCNGWSETLNTSKGLGVDSRNQVFSIIPLACNNPHPVACAGS